MGKSRFFLTLKKGFTLVEIVVVLALMAIAATIVVPNMGAAVSNSKLRKYESSCTSADTYVRNFVTLLKEDESNIPYEKDGKYETYDITVASDLQGALNYYNFDQTYQYYVIPFNTFYSGTDDEDQSYDPLVSAINDEIGDSESGLTATDTIAICIEYNGGNDYKLWGFWYYEYRGDGKNNHQGAIVCTHKCTGLTSKRQQEGYKPLKNN